VWLANGCPHRDDYPDGTPWVGRGTRLTRKTAPRIWPVFRCPLQGPEFRQARAVEPERQTGRGCLLSNAA